MNNGQQNKVPKSHSQAINIRNIEIEQSLVVGRDGRLSGHRSLL